MALADLNVSLGLITRSFERSLRKSEGQLRRFGSRMQRVGKELTTSLTLPIAGAGVVALRTAADFERLQTSFKVLFGAGNEAAAKQFFDDLKVFSARTPFQLKDIADSARNLLAFGFSANQTKDALSFLGDIAAATNGSLGELAQILGKTRAVGKVFTKDLRQLAQRGIPIFDLLKERYKVSGEALQEMVADGKIDFKTLQEVLRDTTMEGGLFAGGMEKQSKTLSGLFSTLKDNVSLAFAEIGDSISEAFQLKDVMDRVIVSIQNAVKVFNNLDDSTKRNIVRIAAVTAAFGPALFIIGKVSTTLAVIPGLLRIVNTQFKALSGSVLGAATSFQKLNGAIAKIGVLGAIAGAITIAVLAFQEIQHEISLVNAEIRTLADVEKRATEAIGLQKTNVELLVGVLEDENATRKEKENALNRLKGINADYFGDLDLEKGKVEGLTKSVDAYIRSLVDQERTKIAIQELAEINNQLADTEELVSKGKPRLIQAATAAVKNFFNPTALAGQVTRTFTTNLNKETDALKRQKTALEELIRSLDTFTESQEGGAEDTGGGTPSERKRTPVVGIDAGLPSFFDSLNNQIDKSNEKFFALTAKARELGFSMEDVTNSNTLATASLEELGANVDIVTQKAGAGAERMKQLTDQVASLGLKASESGGIMVDFEKFAASSILAIGDAFANAGDNFENLGRNIADTAVDIIANLIRVGVAAAISGAFKGPQALIPPLALALATAAGVAASALFKSAISSIRPPRLAEGGLAFSPTLAIVGDNPNARANPEVIAPLDRLMGLMGTNINLSGEFTVRGTDLRLVLDRVDKERTRTRGF